MGLASIYKLMQDRMGSEKFMLEIAKGNIPGVTAIHKFGENPDIDTGTAPEDICDQGGVYNFSTSADIDSISSSDATDKQDVKIYGQTFDNVEVIQTATLDGQTKVTLTTPLFRIYRMINMGNSDIAGTVYCYVDTTIAAGVPADATKIRAEIRGDNNQTLMAIYTIPAGKTGYFVAARSFLTKNRTGKTASLQLKIRKPGGVFQVKSVSGLNSGGTSIAMAQFPIPIKIEEKSDVKIICTEVSADNTAVGASFTILLIDN